MTKNILDRLENNVGTGENARNQRFFLFTQKSFLCERQDCVGKALNDQFHYFNHIYFTVCKFQPGSVSTNILKNILCLFSPKFCKFEGNTTSD